MNHARLPLPSIARLTRRTVSGLPSRRTGIFCRFLITWSKGGGRGGGRTPPLGEVLTSSRGESWRPEMEDQPDLLV